MDEERETMVAEALIGDDAEAFFRSDLGKTIIGLAKQEADLAYAALKTTNPTDQDKIRELQNAIWRSERFEQWLGELISNGEQSLKILQYEDEHE